MGLSAIIGVLLNLLLPGKENGYGNDALFGDKAIEEEQLTN